ncbi:hypothetical protein AMTR_s00031p00144910 [Amborella trichopoda]|uniref:Uncharacterized protein n=1 Tax=Amborella trichopoda TaxID=13333 RepID=U5D2V7_AMBTC|nr:hypothetical protein AMTR_s00031p00144910 [Amborella trichopoda]
MSTSRGVWRVFQRYSEQQWERNGKLRQPKVVVLMCKGDRCAGDESCMQCTTPEKTAVAGAHVQVFRHV